MKSLALLAAAAASVAVAQHNPPRCNGKPNLQPVWEGEPTLVQKVANGLKYHAGSQEPPLIVVHAYGDTMYDMGVAYGQLLQNEITAMIPQVFEWIEGQVNSSLPFLPPAIRNIIATKGIPFALDLTYNITKRYTPAHHYDLMRGVAAGSGIDYQTIARVCLIPELIKAQCSMFGAWGPATAGANTRLVQLRALDWNTNGPFQQWPVLVTWHPAAGSGLGVPFSSLGWAGMVGSLTGVSSSGMGISEKVWLQYQGVENIFGYVWTFLLQDILQFDMDTDQALSRIASANRTCSIWVGIGDKYNNQFKAVGYSNQQVSIYNDRNFPQPLVNHDLFPGLVFINKHVQWSTEPCMNDVFHQFYGKIDALVGLQYITALEQTGDMHIALTDFAKGLIYISNASPMDANGNVVPAYDRPFTRLNLTALWEQPLSA